MLQISKNESYLNEYSDLLQGKRVSSQSKLTPIFNKNLIKIGGLLHSAEVPAKSKRQMVVSKTHPVTTLIIQEVHLYWKILHTILQGKYKKMDT